MQRTEQELLRLVNLSTENLTKALESLPWREQAVIEMRFGLNGERRRILREVGHEFGVSGERIRHIEMKALSRMQDPDFRKKCGLDALS